MLVQIIVGTYWFQAAVLREGEEGGRMEELNGKRVTNSTRIVCGGSLVSGFEEGKAVI